MTDDLCLLVEECTDDLDYVDLPDGIFGVTEFMMGRRPSVRISKALSDNPRMENPLRTTLTHELGHVRFHGPIWELEEQSPRLFDVKKPGGHRHASLTETEFSAVPSTLTGWSGRLDTSPELCSCRFPS